MNELNRILALKAEARTQSDLDYIESHKEELSDEQKAQLEAEVKTLDTNLDEVLEEYEAKFAKKELKNNNIQTQIKEAQEKGTFKTLSFNVEVKDLGERMMEAVISSESIDRHGEQIDMKGMNLKEYMRNPILADGHDYSKSSVGRTHKLTKKADGTLVARFEWATTERAKELYGLYKDGFQFAFSVGFMVEEMNGNVFTKSTLLEFSPVLIPANADALVLAKELEKQKGLDKGKGVDYTKEHMYKLNEILAKELNNLTLGEIAFLKDNASKLTDEQKAQFASVLEVKEVKAVDTQAVADAVKTAVDAAVSDLKAEVDTLKAVDPVKVKNIQINAAQKEAFESKSQKEQSALKFLHYVKGVKSGNFKSYLNLVGKDAMNTTDDGVLLPPADFIAEVERLEETFGVARRFASVRQSTNGNGIRYLSGDDDVEVFDTAEGGVKQSTSLSYAEKTLLWRKFAGILPITDELTEDSAINLWSDATARFARAFARQEDMLVFTNASQTGNQNYGIVHEAGINLITMSGTGSDDSFNDLAYDDLVDMITGVPTTSAMNGRFYFHRELLGVLMKLKDDENRPLWIPSTRDGAPATILGKPYELVEVLPSISDDAQNTPFMVFGDLKYVTLGERTGMNIIIRDTGTVGDPGEEDQETNTLNLFTQDMQAMRAVKRMNSVVRFPAAFSVLTTGNYNS